MFAAIVLTTATPAEARPHHGASRHHAAKVRHHSHRHHSYHHRYRYRHHARTSAVEGAPSARDASTADASNSTNFGGSNIVAVARRYIGGNPTGRASLWCARFMNMVLQRTGHKGTGSDMASSFAHYGERISGPRVGAIAVMSRGRRGGHVGVVSGIDAKGNPIIVSGNHGHRVAEATYSRGRIYAYVMPAS
jgi:uncharacterized protein (TIGR02594 family)